MTGHLTLVSLGPGRADYVLPAAQEALQSAQIVIGYEGYLPFAAPWIHPDAQRLGLKLGEEVTRARLALEHTAQGRRVALIGSGDVGIYAMASVVFETQQQSPIWCNLAIEVIPGISAFQSLSAKVGAAVGHDFCCVSLSNLLTPWPIIERRLRGAVLGDFVTSLYNPRSQGRYWQLSQCKEIFLAHRDARTPVAIGRQLGRSDEHITLTTLGELDVTQVDMFSLITIGNSQSYIHNSRLITPRGYTTRPPQTGQEIQQESFRQIAQELKKRYRSDDSISDVGLEWARMRLVHTTGDVDIAEALQATSNAFELWHTYLHKGGAIVTDVTMVQAGITKQYTEHYHNAVYCYLNAPETYALAEAENLTRSQAGMRLAMQHHPNALFVIGNAPTALIELADAAVLRGFTPAGIIAAPVGFVNVIESKARLHVDHRVPYALIKGRKGGSNLAASLINAAFSLDEAQTYLT